MTTAPNDRPQVIPDLLNALFMLLPKPWSPEAGYHDQQVEVYGIADFDSDQDLIDFMGHFRNNALEVVRLAVRQLRHQYLTISHAVLSPYASPYGTISSKNKKNWTRALLTARAHRMRIGACDPML